MMNFQSTCFGDWEPLLTGSDGTTRTAVVKRVNFDHPRQHQAPNPN